MLFYLIKCVVQTDKFALNDAYLQVLSCERRPVYYFLLLYEFKTRYDVYKTTFTQTCFNYQLNAQFLYSITTHMLHYNPRHVSSCSMLIFRRLNFITASGIVNLRKWPHSTLVESRLSPLSTGLLYSRLQRVTITDAVIIQFDLLKMSIVLLETFRGL